MFQEALNTTPEETQITSARITENKTTTRWKKIHRFVLFKKKPNGLTNRRRKHNWYKIEHLSFQWWMQYQAITWTTLCLLATLCLHVMPVYCKSITDVEMILLLAKRWQEVELFPILPAVEFHFSRQGLLEAKYCIAARKVKRVVLAQSALGLEIKWIHWLAWFFGSHHVVFLTTITNVRNF